MSAAAQCSKKDWLLLRRHDKNSKKGDNGRLLICAGSAQYHGSLILAIKAAVRFCDLVYVYCDGENRPLVASLKAATPNIIILTSTRASSTFLPRIDAVLTGPGWVESAENQRLLARLLKSGKPMVLDAGALGILAKKKSIRPLLHSACILTPHRGEFERLFGFSASAGTVMAEAKKTNAVILCKGSIDLISDGRRMASNTTHHVGMTKGGSGDALAGLSAALMADHNDPFESACASAYLLGRCGLRLSRRMGAHYSSSDLVDELPLAALEIEKEETGEF